MNVIGSPEAIQPPITLPIKPNSSEVIANSALLRVALAKSSVVITLSVGKSEVALVALAGRHVNGRVSPCSSSASTIDSNAD